VRKSTVAEDYFDTLLVVFGGREAPSKSSQSVPCIVRDGIIHRFGGVCALWVLLEPASTARGQNRVSISVVRYYTILLFSSCLAFGMSLVQALGSLMSRLKYSLLACCFGGCMP